MIKIIKAPKNCGLCPFPVKPMNFPTRCGIVEEIRHLPMNGHRPPWCPLVRLEGKKVTWEIKEIKK